MRLFTAITLPHELIKILGRYRDSLGRRIPYVHWTPLAQLHITPLFIGEVSDEKLEMLTNELRTFTLRHVPFVLTIDRVGYAPPGGRARMVWAYTHPSEDFIRLVSGLATAVGNTGIRSADSFAEEKEAHVTLARFDKRMAPPRELIRLPRSGAEGATISVTEVCLMRSRLSPSGPLYTAVERFPLSVQSS